MLFARDKGFIVEDYVCRYLKRHGLKLLQRNYQCRGGEIDSVMLDGSILVFVEVRFRKTARFGSALESVDHRKQSRIIHAASHFLQNASVPHTGCRFDVVGVSPGEKEYTVEWIKNAFQLV